jgi:Flp pilus assembly protein TadD
MSNKRPVGAKETLQALERGLSLHQAGQLSKAAKIYTRILRANPKQPETLDLYGVLLHQTGNDAKAHEFLSRAVALRPDSASFRNHLGAVQRGLGDLEAAVASFKKASDLQPNMHETAFNLAIGLNQLNRHPEAETAARAAVRLARSNPEYRLVLSEALRAMNRDEEAIVELRHAIGASGPGVRLLLPLGRCLAKRGRTGEACRELKRAIVIQPEEKDGYGILASLAIENDVARWGVKIAPGDGLIWGLFASRLCQALDDVNGMAAARKAIILRPDHISGYLNLSDSTSRKYLFQTTLDAAIRGLAVDPNSHHLAVSAAFGEFMLGDVARGWKLYQRRRMLPEEFPRLGLPPEWHEVAPPDGTLLVCAEQGLGDEYLFLSCLPDLLRITQDVLVECEARNMDLLARSFPGARFIPRTVLKRADGSTVWDYQEVTTTFSPSRHVLAGDLMERFGVGMGRPPPKGGYLVADPDERALWSRWHRSLAGNPKVGVCWRSGEADEVRSDFYFKLEDVIETLGPERATYISLVYVDATSELEALASSRNMNVHNPPGIDQRNELDRVAALISSLDLVVSIDNAVAAIAASCGVRTILLERGMFQISADGDVLFANVHPCIQGSRVFNRAEVLAAAGTIFQKFLEEQT